MTPRSSEGEAGRDMRCPFCLVWPLGGCGMVAPEGSGGSLPNLLAPDAADANCQTGVSCSARTQLGSPIPKSRIGVDAGGAISAKQANGTFLSHRGGCRVAHCHAATSSAARRTPVKSPAASRRSPVPRG